MPEEKLAEVAAVVRAQADQARAAGAERVLVVATAAVREASNCGALVEAIEAAAGLGVRVLAAEEEARLSFRGALGTHPQPPPGPVAVLDVGGGSTEVAVGDAPAGVAWWRSYRVGSGTLARSCLRSDPPARGELDAVRARAAEALGELPPCASALAVGGSATSLRRVAGPMLDGAALDRALRAVVAAPAAEVAARLGLAPDRVRLLPAGIAILAELAQRVGRPIGVARGGLREGVVLEAAGSSPAGGAPIPSA
jgi:exopolyphosphatase / guanosine-5'-triphosphate,3'-diphosphate pyrophosphatase